MKQFCRYHPSIPAHWYCDKCNKSLCPQCIDTRNMGGGYLQDKRIHMCPSCNLPVSWLGIANIIEPFWKRIPRFFLYPLSFKPLILMLVLSVASTLFNGPGILGTLATSVIWGVALKYAYVILQSTAGGDLTPPNLDQQTLFENFGPVIKQIGIYIVIFFATVVTFSKLGAVMGGIFLFFAFLLLPSMLILLVTTESLLCAINPMMSVALATRIGWGYLLMVFFYSILGGAPPLLANQVIQHLPPVFSIFFFALVKIFYTFISYHLMGYVILQYHEDIGYNVNFEDFKDTQASVSPQEEDAESRLLKRIDQLVKDGDHQGAVNAVETETANTKISNPLLSQRYYTLLKMVGNHQKLTIYGKHHLDILAQGNKKADALDVYSQCLAISPKFLPNVGALFKLGSWLNETGKSKEAIETFNKLTQAYPKDPLVPKSYFRAAEIFNDRLLNPDKAKQILNGLIKNYPGHDIIPYAERYLADLK